MRFATFKHQGAEGIAVSLVVRFTACARVSAESGFEVPGYPTVFGRFASSLIGHGAPIIRPRVSKLLDYEGEFVAVIDRSGRDIPKARALDHIGGY